MKTLKQIMSESDYTDPKSPGDKAFVDKHVIQKTDYPHKPKDGSNDDIFSGKKQKKKKKLADYEKGQDKEVYEDKMSKGDMKPRVIIRVAVGSKHPIDAGPQHTQNHTEAFRKMLTNVNVVELIEPEDVFPAFKHAYEREDSKPTLMIEYSEYYGTK